MSHKAALLLNLAVLVVGFVVALSASDSQVRVLRATARVAHSTPLLAAARARPAEPERPPAPPPAASGVPRARLLKYLARLEGLDRLSPAQVAALLQSLDRCCEELARESARLWSGAGDGARALQLAGDLDTRMRRAVETSLRAARVPEGRLLSDLVRVVVSSTG